MYRRLVAATLLTAVGALSGCSGSETPDTRDGKPSAQQTGDVDPQVMQDVIEEVYPVPGRSVRRKMRLANFYVGWSIEQCGGTAAPLDSTADRYQQAQYPDLELIRERGFTEPGEQSRAGSDLQCDGSSEGNLADRLPSFVDVGNLRSRWLEITYELLQEPAMVALTEPLVHCLEDGSGLPVDESEPTASWLRKVDLTLMQGEVTHEHANTKWAGLYARCGEEYFGTLKELLLVQRAPLVERHRELLEQYARELVAIGYVP